MTELNDNTRDRLVSVAKGAAGALPVVGGVVSEIFDTVVPDLRLDRVVTYLGDVEKRVTELESGLSNFTKHVHSEQGIDIFEEAILQASRSVSEDRKSRLARLTSYSLAGKELKYEESKKLLNIFRELTDPEIIYLIYYSLNPTMGDGPHRDLMNKHPDILKPKSVVMGAPQEEVDKAALQQSYRNTLIRFGLLTKGERTNQITNLGRLLIRYIGEGN